jgi:hypothetical protein
MVPTVFDYLDFYTMWSSGRGPRHINYGPNDGATRDLMGSSIVQDALAEHASKDCKETTNVDSTHRRPFEEGYLLGAAKAMVGEESPNYTLMQVGGFGGEITTSRGITTVRLTNTASASSFWFGRTTIVPIINKHANTHFDPNAWDDRWGPMGPEHNIQQVFTGVVKGLCIF